MLAAALPAERAICVPGGHDWKTWRQLWDRFLLMPEISAAGNPRGGTTE
jgi:hypothetical protein